MRRPISCTYQNLKKKRFKWHDHEFERQPLRMKENILHTYVTRDTYGICKELYLKNKQINSLNKNEQKIK